MKDEEIISSICEMLTNSGCRVTAQRTQILEVLCTYREEHLTVEEICRLTKISLPKISMATVYKTMLQLEKLGLLYRISVYGCCNKYQLMWTDGDARHHHFICTACGEITDIDSSQFAQVDRSIESEYGVEIEDQSILYYGTCRRCGQRAQAERRQAC